MTVAYGHLFVASHMSFLEKCYGRRTSKTGWPSCPDFRMIADQAKKLGAGEISFRLFSRTDEEYRPTYELIRTGQMPQSETLLGQLLNAMLGNGKDAAPRKQKIDGRTLPEFDAVSHYFGPAGSFVTSEPNGWFVVGFTMNKSLVPSANSEVASVPAKPVAVKPSDKQPAASGNSTAPKAPEQTTSEQPQPPPKPATASATDGPALAPLPGPATQPAEPVTGQKPGETTTK